MNKKLIIVVFSSVLMSGAWASIAPQTKEILSVQEAVAIAEEQVYQGVAKEVNLETRWGKRVYEVEVTTPETLEHDVVIDAQTGKVISIKKEEFRK